MDAFKKYIFDILDRMNKQIKSLLERFPFSKGSNSSEFPSFPALPGSFPGAGDLDLSKGNTTSVTKVINGHKVVINETEYKNQDENGGTFFKVRIVDVAPDSSEITTDSNAEEVPTTIKPREQVDNSFENEISKSKEAEPIQTTKRQVSEENFDNIETFDEIDSSMRISPVQDDFFADENQKTQPGYVDADNEWNVVEPIETIESNDINQPEKESVQRPIDLSRDTYVNEIMAENGAPTDPEAEVFFVPQLEQDGRMIGVLMDPR
ncbi:uncharacterized protein LOC115874685 isoform X2 [Sitophilus oryzae]|uniref:Uncharacterized protein LOC115874685 isoform X2 n=1 Tax=Sitophilus oryzae TaxID=7048 RepID=A0A6J2X440_SITOR|nr:uncharacterized protein LOC115874685 isoform X2 [Sitophilus oryzae]